MVHKDRLKECLDRGHTLLEQVNLLRTENRRLTRQVEKYRKKYQRYHAFFEISSDPFYITSYPGPPSAEDQKDLWRYMSKWEIIEVNTAATKALGYSKRQFATMNLGDIDTHYPAGHEQTRSIMSDLIDPMLRKRMIKIERDHIDRNGNSIAVEIKGRLVTIGDQQYVVSIARDIRERKRFEKEILKAYETEKNYRQKLQREIYRRIEFTRALVHELKTPLTPVLSSSEALVNLQIPATIQYELANNIYSGAKSLNNRIGELLDLAKTEISELVLRKSVVRTRRLLIEVTKEVLPQVTSSGLKLTTDIPSYLPSIFADSDRLKQVLHNVLNNAIKYNKEGGRILIIATAKNNQLLISIRDWGKGITKKDQEKLFQPYFRCEKDRDNMNGLGLGLALSRQLIELQGGTIHLESKRGVGTIVTVMLPINKNESIEGENDD